MPHWDVLIYKRIGYFGKTLKEKNVDESFSYRTTKETINYES